MKIRDDLPYEILDIDQRSPEWFEVRANCVTGTTAKYLIREGLAMTLDRVKSNLEYHKSHPYVGAAAKRGQELEPVARDLINRKMEMSEATKDVRFEEVGFVKRKDIEHAGGSPDGVYIKDGAIKYNLEIKCFMEKHHLECSGTPDEEIMYQIQWCLWLDKAECCFFVQYNPDMLDPEKTSDGKAHPEQVLFITKIYPKQDYFDAFERKLAEEL